MKQNHRFIINTLLSKNEKKNRYIIYTKRQQRGLHIGFRPGIDTHTKKRRGKRLRLHKSQAPHLNLFQERTKKVHNIFLLFTLVEKKKSSLITNIIEKS